MSYKKIKGKIILAFKSWFYTTLTEENIEKIIKRKEEELDDIEMLTEKEIENIKNEMHEELSGYHTEEEIDEIIKNTIS